VVQVAWHKGNGIAQTVFTCLYLHDRTLIRDAALGAFVKCLLKTCHLVRSVVVEGDVYEEEDFVTHCSGYDLLGKEDEAAMVQEFLELEKALAARVKAIKASLKEGGPSGPAVPEGAYPCLDPADPANDLALCEAFLVRLAFRRGLFSVHQHLKKPQCKGCPSAQKSITFTLAQLEILLVTLPLTEGTPAPGFEPHCNRRMLAPTPPRVCPIPEVGEAYGEMKTYLGHLSCLAKVDTVSDYASLVGFMIDFAASGPSAVARSWWEVLVMTEWSVFGTEPILEYVWLALKPFGVVDEMRQNPEVGPYMQMIGKVVRQMFRIFGLNRARLRRKLAVAFADWGVLQTEGSRLDQILSQSFPRVGNAQPFSTWVMDQTMRLLTVHTDLGFELELYAAPHEHRTMHWYLDHVFTIRLQLAQMLSEQADHAESLAEAQAAEEKAAAKPEKGKKDKKDKKKEKKEADKKAKKGSNHSPERLELEGRRLLSRGQFHGMSRLQIGGHLKDKEYTFGELAIRYEKRFAPYSQLSQPMPIPYSVFQQRTDLTTVEPIKLTASAVECTRMAGIHFDKLAKHPDAPETLVSEAKCLRAVAEANAKMMERLLPKLDQEGGGGGDLEQVVTAKAKCDFASHGYARFSWEGE